MTHHNANTEPTNAPAVTGGLPALPDKGAAIANWYCRSCGRFVGQFISGPHHHREFAPAVGVMLRWRDGDTCAICPICGGLVLLWEGRL